MVHQTKLSWKYFQFLLSSNNLLDLALLRYICRKTDNGHNFTKHFKATRLFCEVSISGIFSSFCLALRLLDWCQNQVSETVSFPATSAPRMFYGVQFSCFEPSKHSRADTLRGKLALKGEIKIRIGRAVLSGVMI